MADNAQKVRDIIEKELGVEREKLTDEASFIEDLGADSLDIVELVMEFEKEFNIDIPDEDAEKLRTVGDAIGVPEQQGRARDEASGRRHRARCHHATSATTWRRPGARCWTGVSGAADDHEVRRHELPRALRLRGEGLRSAAVRWTARKPSAPTRTRSTRSPPPVEAMNDAGLADQAQLRRRPHRRHRRQRHRRAEELRGAARRLPGARAEQDLARSSSRCSSPTSRRASCRCASTRAAPTTPPSRRAPPARTRSAMRSAPSSTATPTS